MGRTRSINQDDLRNHNLSVVLSTLLRSVDPLSRAHLAKATGLTKATMSLLSEILIRNGVVEQLAPRQRTTNGRPSTPLGICPGRFMGIGMQINTDGYGYTVTDVAGGTVMGQWVDRVMDHVSADDVFASLDGLVADAERQLAAQGCRVVGAGLALPGLVSGDRLIVANNLGWTNVDLGRYDVVRRLDAVCDNEANMAAVAQIPGYASKRTEDGTALDPTSSFLYISTDVGVGGAVVRGGAVERGDHGFAGELGHVSVNMNGPKCRCGRHGCLEMYAGRRELVRTAGIADGDEAVRAEYVRELHRRWRDGDTRAVLAIDQALSAMASVAASAINILDLDTIVLGGFWSAFEEDLTTRLRMRIVPQVLARYAMDVKVLACTDVDRPALHGAAAYGLRRFVDRPVDFLDA